MPLQYHDFTEIYPDRDRRIYGMPFYFLFKHARIRENQLYSDRGHHSVRADIYPVLPWKYQQPRHKKDIGAAAGPVPADRGRAWIF